MCARVSICLLPAASSFLTVAMHPTTLLSAAMNTRYREERPRYYHAVTRGVIIGALLKRVDPEGRTLGNFIQEEICDKLGTCGERVSIFRHSS